MLLQSPWQARQQDRLYYSTLLIAWGLKQLVHISELLTIVRSPSGAHV